eukprot:s2176_g14.t1
MAPRRELRERRERRGQSAPTDYRGCITCFFMCSIALVASIGSFYFSSDDMEPVNQRQRSTPPRPKVAAVAAPEPVVMPVETSTAPPRTPEATPATTQAEVVGTAEVTTTTSPVEAEPLEQCKTVAFLRIQKTASTTFGQEIMSKMCGKHHQQCSQPWDHCNFGRKKCSVELYQYHLEYNNARQFTMGQGRGCIVTIVRDPIERVMSEYFMLKLKHRQFLSFDQWDVHQDDIPEIDAILSMPDISESFQKYLHHPRNPSRNRQTLYLLGFPRVACNSSRCGGNACICDANQPGYPATLYDWDANATALLETAKAHLRSLDAFGLVECFNESVQVIANTLGWDLKTALTLAQNQALHVWKPTMEKAREIRIRSAGAARRLSFTGPGHNFWREFLQEDVKREIQQVNSLDVELVKFAREEFRRKYGMKCEEMPSKWPSQGMRLRSSSGVPLRKQARAPKNQRNYMKLPTHRGSHRGF